MITLIKITLYIAFLPITLPYSIIKFILKGSRTSGRNNNQSSNNNYRTVLFNNNLPNFDSYKYVKENVDDQNAYIALHSLFTYSCSIYEQKGIKAFFDAYDNIMDSFEKCMKFQRFYTINIKEEISHFLQQYDYICYDFIRKSFDNMYSVAISYKRENSRIKHIEHWFFEMDYYRDRLPEKSLNLYLQIKQQWQ